MVQKLGAQSVLKQRTFGHTGKEETFSVSRAKARVVEILNACDIKIGGRLPGDIHVHDERFFNRVIREGALGLGESYMDGWWNCANLDVFAHKLISHDVSSRVRITWNDVLTFLGTVLFNGPKFDSYKIGKVHYDLGNDFYRAMLGESMAYSCAYWQNARTLEEAQQDKLELIARKLGLRAGQKVLDVGCGWGSFARYAALNHGAYMHGVTVSKQQAEYGSVHCNGLPVKIELMDYRRILGVYDHIVSIGMFEHVGVKNYGEYMKIIHRSLDNSGLFLLHTIGSLRSGINMNAWIRKYIFPNSMLPSLKQIAQAAEGLFVIEDVQNIGAHYDRTLMAWNDNFEASWQRFSWQYSHRFYRMWRFYLLMCAGSFRARHNQVWQIVFSKRGVPGGYRSIR